MRLREFLGFIDAFTVVVFSTEIVLKWMDNFKAFWKDYWNVFDLLVTVLVSEWCAASRSSSCGEDKGHWGHMLLPLPPNEVSTCAQCPPQNLMLCLSNMNNLRTTTP